MAAAFSTIQLARLSAAGPPPAAEALLAPVARLVQECMEGVAAAVRLRVPLRVRLASGPSWGQLKDVQL